MACASSFRSSTDVLTPPLLQGPSVVLRLLSLDDAEALAAAAAESREQYAFTRVPEGVEDAQRYIATALAERETRGRLPFATLWHGRVVGSTSYLGAERWPASPPPPRGDSPDVVEIGATWLAASAQRTRCNTEAKRLMLAHAFDVWRVHRVSLKTDARNAKSRRAVERLGALFEGVRRADMPAQDGSVRDSAYYSIVRAEWPDVRKRLDAALG
jgi:N-acetyltransferase